MPALTEQREFQSAWQAPPVKPLDGVVWQAWLAKGRRRDARSTRTRLEAVKMASIAALLTAAGLWSYIAPYEKALGFVVAMAAIFVMLHAFLSRRYFLGALFGALVLLWNPVVPLLQGSEDLQRLLLAISTGPFIVSLGWAEASKPTPGEAGAVEHRGLRS